MATSKLDHPLTKFLNARITTDSKCATMTCMAAGGGKWFIADEHYPEFIRLMHDYLFIKKFAPRSFVEQPRKGEPKPLLIDLDFRYPVDVSLTRTFTLEQIGKFCEQIVLALKAFFTMEADELRFFVTLRPAPYRSGQATKDGIHIMCPDIALSNEKQKAVRNWMLSQDTVRKCFADTGFTNEPEDIYDESMVRKQGWIFYGESKPNIPPYKLESVYRYSASDNEWDNDPTPYTAKQLMTLLSVRYGVKDDTNVVREEAAAAYAAIQDWGAPPPVIHEQTPEEAAQRNETLLALQAYSPGNMDDEERIVLRRLTMECLKDERASNYDTWIRVGWCLHNIDPSEDGFQLWMDFSARSTKSTGNNTAQLKRDWFHGWRKEGEGPRLTDRSLKKWAREDNPDLYTEIVSEYLSSYIKNELEPTHHHVAKLMKKMYGPNYVASNHAKDTVWYKYDDSVNMWQKLNQGIELRMKVNTEVADKISAASMTITVSEATKVMNDVNIEKRKVLLKVQTSLYNSGFGNSVMEMAKQQFNDERFEGRLNINPYLFACHNGILDLRVPGADGRDHVVFRDGRPEDYVSFLGGQNLPEMEAISYKPYNPEDPAQLEIADFFSKLFPDKDVRAYTLRLLASCLEGTNKEQCFYVATGVGGNGKSKLVELMRMTFGDYQTSLQATVLTRKRPESGAANPDIMAVKCRRFIYLQEPDDKEPINTSRMKQFSGEDMVEARALYGDQEKFMIMGKMIMMCNKLPPVTTMDRGTWRRIRVIEFVSKFVMPDHPEYLLKRPNVFLIDPLLDKKLRTWREPFLALLVHIYEKEYLVNGLSPVPAAVMRAVDKYKENFDLYARFRGERVRLPMTEEERTECRMNPIATKAIKSILASWNKDAKVSLDFDTVANRLSEEFGEPMNGKLWPAIMVFSDDGLVAEHDAKHEVHA